MTTQELFQLLQTKDFHDHYFIVDVRNQSEWEFNKIPYAHHFPLHDLAVNHLNLPTNKRLILYCHHGIRSQHACQLLNSLNFDMVENLEGGIHCWAVTIDPTTKRY